LRQKRQKLVENARKELRENVLRRRTEAEQATTLMRPLVEHRQAFFQPPGFIHQRVGVKQRDVFDAAKFLLLRWVVRWVVAGMDVDEHCAGCAEEKEPGGAEDVPGGGHDVEDGT
jgi:hypothetical protein